MIDTTGLLDSSSGRSHLSLPVSDVAPAPKGKHARGMPPDAVGAMASRTKGQPPRASGRARSEERRTARQPGDRDRGHLPVPVEGCVHEKRGVGAGCPRGPRPPPRRWEEGGGGQPAGAARPPAPPLGGGGRGGEKKPAPAESRAHR